MPDRTMRNFKLTLEFDGTEFHGWQKQPGLRTVQGVMENAAGELFSQPVAVAGCCRTDAGVHAAALVCNFLAETALPAERVHRAMEALLPEDVVVRDLREVPEGFHARHDAIARRYVYHLTGARTALDRRMCHYCKYALDVSRMARAAGLLVGEHDFTSFAPISLAPDVSPVCTVSAASVRGDGAAVVFDITADRFLHHMVRTVVGTLVEVGRGRIPPERVGEILCKRDRKAAGPTVPACGLVLTEVFYPQ